MSKHYTTGDVVDVRIEKIVPRGFGLAFAENLTILVPLTAPGDVLRVRIREIKKRMAFAGIVEIKQSGPRRIAPPCEYFGTCGGCDFQQMSYAAQLDAKVGLVRDCLHRIGKIEYEEDISIIPSPNEFGYRSRARWHLDREKKTIGYFRRDSHDVIDIHSCPILTPGLQSTLEYIRESMNWDAIWNDRAEMEAATGEEGRVSIYSADMAEPTAELSFAVNGDTYEFSAETFFQANKFLIPELIEAAIGDAGGDAAFDLYCGVGLFTLPMARRFAKVVGVEESSTAVEFAQKNIDNARLSNVKLVNKSVGKFLAENQKKRLDLILIDPPRSGTEKQTIVAITKLKPAQISYVSCEPSILARDLRILLDAGYSIEKITALDLFPQTHHVETLVRLKIRT
ncbi:MAG: class I SAM-dependent RNA methyltransferase [Pyrinomonadaceae bacterium]